MKMSEKVRIKKGVRPYGGRIVEVIQRHTYPNGRKVVSVVRPGSPQGKGGFFVNPAEYEEHEIEAVDSANGGEA